MAGEQTNTAAEGSTDSAQTENTENKGTETQSTDNGTKEASSPTGNTVLSIGDSTSKQNADGTLQSVVPEQYVYELPEGMEMNAEQKALFEANAREIGLSNEQAQIMLKLDSKRLEASAAAHQKQVARWAEEIKMDKQMGGAEFESTVAYAKAGLSKFDPDGKLFSILDSTGYGNHPDVIRVMSSIGKAHAEDMVTFGDNTPEEQPRHERLYGKYNNM